ncbi:MAG TPA: S8 family serine peptidase [Vicinamibacterales bacterium]|nr:S8 family serine peptidase [Vicinamibacterales bacterium]
MLARLALLGLLASGVLVTSPAAAAPDLVEQAVRDRLQREGRARVIVELQLPGGAHVPEGLATPAQVAAQRRDIADGQTRILARLAAARHRVVHRYRTVPLLALEVETDALRELEVAPFLVRRVMEDALMKPTLAESGPLVEADQVWARGHDGTGRTIAILDTGVDSGHPFLQQQPGGPSKVVEEACYSSTVSGVSESVCPGGAGAETGPGTGIHCPDLDIGCGHGTHVAGIAAGSGESAGVPFSGVAPGATLMAVQVFSKFTRFLECWPSAPPCLLAYTADIIAGLERVYERSGAHSFASVNMSLGGGLYTAPCDSQPYKPIIDSLRSVGIATVVAAGNEYATDAISSPACVSSAVSVGSTTDETDEVSSFSNMASFMSLLAPGQTTTSSYPGGTFLSANGTSMATPHVAGAFALLEQAAPGATPTEILDALRDTGQPVTDTRPGGTVTAPRIRLLAALEALVGAGEVVIDNAAVGVQDASRSFTGTWCVSSAGGFYGTDSLYSCGNGTETYRWTPNLAAGTYDVFVRWTQHVNRSATVPISVVHAGGTSTRTFDQRAGGGQWVFHGRYAFNAGTGGHVEVTDANGQAAADAVRLVPAPPDTTRPDTSITSGPDGTIDTGTATFTWTGTDDVTPADGLVYAYRLEPLEAGFSAFGPATSRTYTGLVNGAYTFHVKSRDSSGNEDASPATRTFAVNIGAGIIDNAPVGVQDASRTFTGTWCVSSAGGFYGTGSLYSCGNGTLDTYRWTPTLTAGTYDVYVWWTQHSNRSTTVPISVTHAGGTTTRTFNQRTGGGQWVLHGRYTFNAGTGGYVQVSDANGQAAADAVRFVPVPSGEIIVDNAAVGSQDASRSFTGTWCVSSAGGFYGTGSLYSCGNGTLDTYRWTPTLTAGSFDVYVWWTQHPNRSTTVPISVTHAGGTTTRTFNQRTGGGQWVLHGRYTFNAGTGGYVQVSDASGQAAADAVRFAPAP